MQKNPNKPTQNSKFQFKFVFTKAEELQFLSQVQWLGFALCISKGGKLKSSHFPGDFGYPGRDFCFLFALKALSE